MKEGIALMNEAHHRKAAKCFSRLIELDPFEPASYANLGQVLLRSGDISGAATLLQQAKTLCEVSGQQQSGLWARSLARAFHAFEHPRASQEPQPAWWDDALLCILSDKALSLSPESVEVWQMRAVVLQGGSHVEGARGWNVGQRSLDQLREIGECYRHAAGVELAPSLKRDCLDMAQVSDEIFRDALADVHMNATE